MPEAETMSIPTGQLRGTRQPLFMR